MITSEQPPVVELEELLEDQESPSAARTERQIALIVVLAVLGVVLMSVLASWLLPALAEVVRYGVFLARLVQGS